MNLKKINHKIIKEIKMIFKNQMDSKNKAFKNQIKDKINMKKNNSKFACQICLIILQQT
jgi:hypothetical protein